MTVEVTVTDRHGDWAVEYTEDDAPTHTVHGYTTLVAALKAAIHMELSAEPEIL